MKPKPTIRDMNRLAPAWRPEHVISRLQSCRVMLACYGLLTDRENEAVKVRLAKLANEEAAP